MMLGAPGEPARLAENRPAPRGPIHNGPWAGRRGYGRSGGLAAARGRRGLRHLAGCRGRALELTKGAPDAGYDAAVATKQAACHRFEILLGQLGVLRCASLLVLVWHGRCSFRGWPGFRVAWLPCW